MPAIARVFLFFLLFFFFVTHAIVCRGNLLDANYSSPYDNLVGVENVADDVGNTSNNQSEEMSVNMDFAYTAFDITCYLKTKFKTHAKATKMVFVVDGCEPEDIFENKPSWSYFEDAIVDMIQCCRAENVESFVILSAFPDAGLKGLAIVAEQGRDVQGYIIPPTAIGTGTRVSDSQNLPSLAKRINVSLHYLEGLSTKANVCV